MSPIFIGPQSSSQPSPGFFAWQMGVFREPLFQGERGTAQTIAAMRELVDQALRDPQIVRLAMDIVGSAPQFDDPAEAQAIYDWISSNIRFTKDPVNKEKLYPPQELLKARAGDCDDISMLMAALLMAVGYPARLITVAASGGAPDQFSHVYVETEVPPGSGQWIPMDAARPDSLFGFEPPMYYRKRAWSLTDDSYQDLSGTKIFARGNVVVRLAGLEQSLQTPFPTLGNYPRFRSLGDYRRFRSLGQDDTSALIAQVPGIETGIANIVAAAKGATPSWQTSFHTRNTPGWGIPPAGYSSPQQSSTSWLVILAVGLLAWKMLA